jgi:hypothetical protein
MSSPIQRLQLRDAVFKEPTMLRAAINRALAELQDLVSDATVGVTQLRVLAPVEVVISSNTPGTLPWPLRLSQAAGSPAGIALMAIQNLTTAGSAGIPTTAVSVTSWHVEAGTVFADFVSGLTLNSRYRLTFGVYNA